MSVFGTLYGGPPGQVPPPPPADAPPAPAEDFAPEPVPFWDAVKAGFDNSFKVQRAGAREERWRAQLWERHAEVEKRLGKKLPRSRTMIEGFTTTDDYGETHDMSDPDGSRAWLEASQTGGARFTGLDDDAYEQQLETLRAEQPDRFKGVATRAELDAARDKALRAIAARSAQASAEHPVGEFLGGAGGSFVDPVNILATAYTGPLGAGRGLLTRMLVQGAANAGIEAAQEPFRARDARFGGPEWTPGQAATNVAGGFVAGSAFEGVGDLLGLGFRAAGRRLFASPIPEERGLGNALDALLRDEAAIGERHGESWDEAAGALDWTNGPPKVPALDPDRDLGQMFQNGETTELYRGREIHAARFDPADLETLPQTFQYKADGDAQGVTARLKGIEAWDPTASGKVIIWEDAAGRRFVADGHQRLGLAQRLAGKGHEVKLDGYLMREADGWSPRDVRVVAALKNIREGSGTILDAAKVFRDAPDAVRDKTLPVTGDFMAQARGLARLSPDAFRAVINKVIPERYGAEVGAVAGDRPDLHDGIVKLLHAAEPANADEARALIAEALQHDWIKSEGSTADLFGYDSSVSTMIGRAKVAAAVLAELRKDARLFTNLVRNADAIEAGGNALARDANEVKLAIDRAALDVVAKMAMRAGPLGEAMAEAALRVAKGEAPGKVAKGILQRLRKMIADGEHLDQVRADVLTPDPPTPAAIAQAEMFDDPHGPGVQAQVKPKPEEAALEAWTPARASDGIAAEMVANYQAAVAAYKAEVTARKVRLAERAALLEGQPPEAHLAAWRERLAGLDALDAEWAPRLVGSAAERQKVASAWQAAKLDEAGWALDTTLPPGATAAQAAEAAELAAGFARHRKRTGDLTMTAWNAGMEDFWESFDQMFSQFRRRRGDDNFRQREEAARKVYDGDAVLSGAAAGLGEDGRYPLDDLGFVLSDAGTPLHFADQKAAARWVLDVGQKQARSQLFELANHPVHGFGIMDRGVAEGVTTPRGDPMPFDPERPVSLPARALDGPPQPTSSPDLELLPEEIEGGLFDDLPGVGGEARAHARLLPCAPGK